jgi:hypothetical protein
VLIGDAGNDTIHAIDGVLDTLVGGVGNDILDRDHDLDSAAS